MCKESKIKVILCKAKEKAVPFEMDNNLKSLQETVGGYIECIYPYEDEVAIICNEEGKIMGLPLNRGIYIDGELVDIVAGDFIIVGLTDEDFGSLSSELMQKYLEVFKYPETFIRVDNKIIRIKEGVK